jgi:protein-tyrosine phosphatase
VIDLHNHLLPGVDDGAHNVAEAVEAFERMRQVGITRLAATPHLDGSLTLRGELEPRLQRFDRAFARLAQSLGDSASAIVRGAEVKLDVPDADLSDPRLRLGGTRYVLVEFPFMAIPPQSVRAIERIRDAGWIPVIAHPERYGGAVRRLDTIESWRQAGACLQVNCGSILGRYGPESRTAAFTMLERGIVDLLASDYHCRGSVPNAAAGELLRELGAAEQKELLLTVNPERILNDASLLPVPALPLRRSLWNRITHVFR